MCADRTWDELSVTLFNQAPWMSKSEKSKRSHPPPRPICVWLSLNVSLLFQEYVTKQPYGRREKGARQALQTPGLWWWVKAQGLLDDLRGAAAKKQVVKSGTASQRSGGAGVFADHPLVRPKPQSPSSDVCVSSLMKKFWYLGETLLSAEQTLPLPCPQPLQSHPAAPPQSHSPPSHQELWLNLSSLVSAVNENTGTFMLGYCWGDKVLNPKLCQCVTFNVI